MTSHCDHGTPLTEDCGKCREIVDRQREMCAMAYGGDLPIHPQLERTETMEGEPGTARVTQYFYARGLTKREVYAAMAMQGLLADNSTDTAATTAKRAVAFADALLKELAK
jgi:hypothetical protein